MSNKFPSLPSCPSLLSKEHPMSLFLPPQSDDDSNITLFSFLQLRILLPLSGPSWASMDQLNLQPSHNSCYQHALSDLCHPQPRRPHCFHNSSSYSTVGRSHISPSKDFLQKQAQKTD